MRGHRHTFALTAALATVACGPSTPPRGHATSQPNAATTIDARAGTGAPRLVDRAAFARALAKVKPGMDDVQVRELVGPPDDVKTATDPGGITAARTVEIWRYGTNGHLTFPTLGSIHMMADNTVQYVFGGRGEPPSKSMFAEADLRELLRVLDRAPSYNSGVHYDPLAIVRAVNALHPLGKSKAVAAIAEYLRVSSWLDDPGREGVFLVLRSLFQVPTAPGHMPTMMVGAPSPAGPKDPKVLPRFPLVLIDDVPLLLVTGYMLAGRAEPPEWHLAKFRKLGVLRAKPLRPTDDPVALADRLVGSPSTPFMQRTGLEGGWTRAMIINQILTAMDTVFRLNRSNHGARFGAGKHIDRRWQAIKTGAKKRRIRWDATTQRYTFRDGTTLPVRVAKLYQREIWNLRAVPGARTATLVLERKATDRVRLALRVQMRTGQRLPHLVVRLFNASTNRQIATLELGEPGPGGSSATWTGSNTGVGSMMTKSVPLAAGIEVQPVLELGGNKHVGPKMRP